MSHVFISYARDAGAGQAFAEQLQTHLQNCDIAVFRDADALRVGVDWADTLEQAIQDCTLVVLVLSAKVADSKWVRREFLLAENLNRPVLPVLVESMPLPWWMTDIHIEDYSQLTDWARLLSAIIPYFGEPESDKITKTYLSPNWAASSDDDQYGYYADLQVNDAVQRLRWIASSDEKDAGFWLADTECTQAFWEAVMSSNPAEFKLSPEHPVERVSWSKVQQFLQKLSAELSGVQARLPTEQEWDLACRAGTISAYAFGDDVTQEQVNFAGQSTLAVKSLPPNAWGLYAMHGNVWEWCEDGDDRKVIRGGSWAFGAEGVRSDVRGLSAAGNRDYTIGFRFVLIF